ncbi:NIPSNAP family protein [Siccirubricoccus sp. KC 17139]|uniref:NIPSNAP family protein n=1 Tax=Siccirubricoccus soli TaxID=2899147 RepID=A0ABT1D763_9PROT|nr:NIPSNAP family protein [Siccirubricoccus soli]MCO6417029.1 NIPSNAP family protein [Siccirubricoccus soli]MCP2683164.1 NIPSNAP family protein [Siccirubricoccus soli]
MFLEQRIYTAHAGKLPLWLKAYGEIGGAASGRTLTPLIGMFTVEFGQINRVLFVRGFDDIDTREENMPKRDADPDWQRFLATTRETGALFAQEAKLLKTLPFSPLQKVGQPFERKIEGTGMFVDHRTYDFHPGKMQAWIDAYRDLGLPVQQRLLGQLLWFAVTEVGPINQVVFAWAYSSLGDRDRRRTAMAADPGWAEFQKATAPLGALKQQTNLILKPVPWSPIR